jgi:hypothetical protein
MRAGTLFVLIGLLVAERAAVAGPAEARIAEARITEILRAQCADCHDADHRLALEALPPATSVAAWRAIYARVSDYSMPPPVKSGDDFTARFPIRPEDRRALVEYARDVAGAALDDGAPPPRHMPHDIWMAMVRDLATGLVPAARLDHLLGPYEVHRGGHFSVTPEREMPALHILAVRRLGVAVCSAMASADMARAPARRTYLIAARSEWARRLLERMYARRMSASEIEEALALMTRFHALTTSWPEAWAGLCATHLTGPRIFYDAHVAPAGGTP